jgi:hypothetical protein
MIRRALPALVALVVALPLSVAAQQEFAASSPEAATIAYIEAMKESRLDAMAGMMHPEALASFRGVLQPVLDVAGKSADGSSEVLQMFDGVTSIAQLAKLSDAKFYAAFYAGIISLEPELLDVIKGAETEVLGHVMEGEDTAHVLYRMTIEAGTTIRKTEVVSLRRTKSGWGILLSAEVEGMAEGIRQSLEMHQ